MGKHVMASNPYFVSYVESVQESLAVFSMRDTDAANYVISSGQTNIYKPKFLIFENLFNHVFEENGKTIIRRKFDPKVSDKLLSIHQPKLFLEDLKRLYENAKNMGVDWQSVKWKSQESDQLNLSDLGEEMKILSEIYETRVRNLKTEELPSEQDLQDIKRIINKLIQRYEIEYIPTNFGASAIIYEAWKLGRFFSLNNQEGNKKLFISILNGLFIQEKRVHTDSLLLEMSQRLGLEHLAEIEKSCLTNNKIWTKKLSEDPHHKWFACVEQSLIHKVKFSEDKRKNISNRYLIHYPLIIDTYWFAGLAYLYAKDDSKRISNTLYKKPEIFDKKKYCKIYNVIQTVSETLKLSLRFDALSKAEEKFQQQLSFEDLFLETVKDYFVCFNVSKTGEKANTSATNKKLIYCNYGIDIYGPEWLSDKHQELIRQELDGNRQVAGVQIPGLYEDLQAKKHEKEKIQMQGREEQSRQIAHQAAGLVAEVWDDPVRKQLEPRKKASLWQLKSLVDIWGNFDLQPNKNISEYPDPDFPEWETLTNQEVFQELINISLCHALRRATYTRTSEEITNPETQEADRKTVDRAIEISMSSEKSIDLFRNEVFGLSTEKAIEWLDGDCPSWLRHRGFAICFHHCFWQAAYHAFRAKCANQPSPYLYIQVNQKQVIIKNRKEFNKMFHGQQPRDVIFFDSLTKRMQDVFDIQGPDLDLNDGFWQTIITKNDYL
ncbi:hypothetical protein [Nostoc parmelioides]|uniref:Uncharacterized protein n=1 Tax=Nostoc parmelioides FACHB-3921 TaxID=2692909 RepID=A0ABR8BMC7_9NOSO|nr:hypothetical protein [Nostoc parmelioides]MBD2254444.1 hypothetical protein [Nostoc parmelioides FACHB-3921]